jgi:FHS family L-fucose permease-like MFS transporter
MWRLYKNEVFMSGVSGAGSHTAAEKSGQQNYNVSLVWLTSLFFMWGFLTCLNDILIPHLKNVFDLTYARAMLVQFCFFGAYFIVSVPAGILVKKVGYKAGIVIGLAIAAVGCLLFYPAAQMRIYEIFLAALFVLAAGITILQVSANPYVTILGEARTAPSRLTLTQAFNSLGTTIAPLFGSVLILAGATVGMSPDELKAHEAQAVQGPYLMLAGALIVLAGIFAMLKLPRVIDDEIPVHSGDLSSSAWSHPHLVLGAIGIFVYVGAEVAIGSFLVNFISDPGIGAMSEAEAATYVAYYWGAAMVGRFIGAFAMRYVSGGAALAFSAAGAGLMVALAMLGSGKIAMWAILAVGLFNAIMFPTIFSLALRGLGAHTSQGSGILCMAIVGGALIPLLQGVLADAIGIQMAFFLPIICYLYIAFYGVKSASSK